MSKVDYVRRRMREGDDGRHFCHWPGCQTKVPPALWGCRKHWFTLPKRLRDKIWRTFRAGQEVSKTPSTEYQEAAREVQDWIADHDRMMGQGRLV